MKDPWSRPYSAWCTVIWHEKHFFESACISYIPVQCPEHTYSLSLPVSKPCRHFDTILFSWKRSKGSGFVPIQIENKFWNLTSCHEMERWQLLDFMATGEETSLVYLVSHGQPSRTCGKIPNMPSSWQGLTLPAIGLGTQYHRSSCEKLFFQFSNTDVCQKIAAWDSSEACSAGDRALKIHCQL